MCLILRYRSRYWYFMAKISMPEWDSAPLEEFSLSIERLYAYGVGMALTSIHNPYPMTSLSGNKNLMMSLPKIPDLAYDVGVGPRSLNLAILRGSSEEVTEICHEKPSSINETILSNISPYHLSATFYPPALQILRDSGLLNSAHPNLSYSGGNTVLEEALACSGEVCNSQPGQHPCQQCCCFESVALLLDLDCAIIWRAQLAEASCSASYRARSILLDHLRNRRERLKEWAIRHLPSSEARKLGLHKTVMLDYPDLELLFDALNQHKLNVPSYLVPFRDQYDSLSTPASVFSFVVLASTAETLYEMGFHNVDTTDFFRHPYIHNLFTIKWPLSLHLEVEYLGWLLGKDTAVPPWSTDIHQRYPISRTDMLGHLVASRLGTYFRFRAQGELMSDLESPSSTIPTILKSLVRMEDRDECKCFCSYSGCSALTTCLNEWNKWSSFGPAIGNSDWYFIPILEKYLDESSDPDDIERFAMQHIRFLTFSALGCSHTCCRDEQDMCEITPEDREAVWEEDKENLDLLEQLVGEFSTDYHSRGLATSTFLKEIWELRMEHVLAERDRDLVARRLSEEDVKAARKLGVTLTMDEDNESEPESVTMWFSDEHETADEKEERKIQREQRIAHMKKRIDQICKWDV
ncbi:hypothetical protein BJ170DRAFT_375769 [Xylariales sp. AK1849]|nr:hypothetical protein BJ170DRAFT_375769 [Xylariales sp. AK1849]